MAVPMPALLTQQASPKYDCCVPQFVIALPDLLEQLAELIKIRQTILAPCQISMHMLCTAADLQYPV